MTGGTDLDGWFKAGRALGIDPFELLRRWTPRQLRAFLAWLDREWENPSLTDHYLMRLMAEHSLREHAQPEDYRVRFERVPAGDEKRPRKRAKPPTKAEAEAAQKAKDKLDSLMWRGMIEVAGAMESDKRKDKGK